MRNYVSLVLALLVYTTITFYIGWNGWVWLQSFSSISSWYLYGLIVALFAYSYFIGHRLTALSFLKTLGAYWMGFFQYSLLLLPTSNVIVWLLTFTAVPRTTAIFIVGSITIVIYITIFSLGSYHAFSPVVRTYNIHIPKKVNRKTLRIAMASDMHFGGMSGMNHLKRLVKNINDMEPDLILFPGDIIDDDPAYYIKKNMRDEMKKLRAPLGTYGVLGNHEYYGGAIPEFLDEMGKSNVRILLDDVIKIEESFYIVGRKDKTDRKRESFTNLVEKLDKNLPIIAMDHQPYDLQSAADNGVDLLLCGHTHRGQMAPNHIITRRMYEIDWGYKQKGTMHTIVSSGFGFWGPPLRIGSRSEIIRIDVTFDGLE